MPHATHTVTIDRPIDEVFGYLADGTNNLRWRSGVLEIERTAGDNGVGTTYRQVLSGPGGRRIAGDYRVTAYDRPTGLAFVVIAGPAQPTGRFDLRDDGPSRTTVTFTLDLQPTGMMRLMSGMIGKQMRDEVAQLTRLKTNMEAG